MMIHFECDYTEGAHPKILEALVNTNMVQTTGYGVDEYCMSAKEKIKKVCENDHVDIHFLVGGTQANVTVISSILRPYQGVISADSGHINVHETGAIETLGHKVLPISSVDGKISANQVEELARSHYEDGSREHTVQPGMVYISQPTENGTCYSKQELAALSEVCRHYEMPLFVDGARLGYGCTSEGNDITLANLAKYCDVFYIGGTKVGALFGEAVVIVNENLKKDFRYNIKQKGGMLAKGRLLGLQFDTLFTNNLYFEIAQQANIYAMQIKKALKNKGIPFRYETNTNQLFPIFNDEQLAKLSKKFIFSMIEKKINENTVRICTSWATQEENVQHLINEIETL